MKTFCKKIWLKNRRKFILSFWSFLLFTLAATIWLSIKHQTFVTFFHKSYYLYFFKALRFEVLVGSVISIVGIIISILILDAIKKYTIKNMDDFLEKLSEFFEKCSNSDKLLIVTPTLYFGKTKTENRFADIYLGEMKKKILNGVKVDLYTKVHDSNNSNKYLTMDTNWHKLSHVDNSNDELIDFHNRLFKYESKNPGDPEEKEKYFNGLFHLLSDVYKAGNINIHKIPQKFIDTGLILFINKTKYKIGFLGIYNEKEFTINGNLVDDESSNKALEKLFEA